MYLWCSNIIAFNKGSDQKFCYIMAWQLVLKNNYVQFSYISGFGEMSTNPTSSQGDFTNDTGRWSKRDQVITTV